MKRAGYVHVWHDEAVKPLTSPHSRGRTFGDEEELSSRPRQPKNQSQRGSGNGNGRACTPLHFIRESFYFFGLLLSAR